MNKPDFIIRNLGKAVYQKYKCSECHSEGKDVDAEFSSGPRSPDGIGYDMKALCSIHQKEFEEKNGIILINTNPEINHEHWVEKYWRNKEKEKTRVSLKSYMLDNKKAYKVAKEAFKND